MKMIISSSLQPKTYRGTRMASRSLFFSARYETTRGILYRYSSSQDAEMSSNAGYRDVLPRILSTKNDPRQLTKAEGILCERGWGRIVDFYSRSSPRRNVS